MNDAALVRYEASEGIALLTLDSPPANTYSYDLNRRLDESILRARMDDAVHVVVIRGAGDRFFCAGAEVPLESGLAIERELRQRLFTSGDAKEGIAAYNEKRKPSFRGR